MQLYHKLIEMTYQQFKMMQFKEIQKPINFKDRYRKDLLKMIEETQKNRKLKFDLWILKY